MGWNKRNVIERRANALKTIINVIKEKNGATIDDILSEVPYKLVMTRELIKTLVNIGLITKVRDKDEKKGKKKYRYVLVKGIDDDTINQIIDQYIKRTLQTNVKDAVIECLMLAPEQKMKFNDLVECVNQQYLFTYHDVRQAVSKLLESGLVYVPDNKILKNNEIILVAPYEGIIISPALMKELSKRIENIEDAKKLLEIALSEACDKRVVVLDIDTESREIKIRCGNINVTLNEADSSELLLALQNSHEMLHKVGNIIKRMINKEIRNKNRKVRP